MAFLLFTRADRYDPWRLVQCEGNTYFEAVEIDAATDSFAYLSRRASGDRAGTTTMTASGLDRGEVSIVPFPSRNWGNMKGYYHLQVHATCDGGVCGAR
jgi:hypothetical protein